MCRYGNILNPRTRIEMQLQDWSEGLSVHNDTDGVCVPDYSCCYPELSSPPRARTLYLQYLRGTEQSDQDLALQMESMFRGSLLILGGQTVVCNDAPYDLDAYH